MKQFLLLACLSVLSLGLSAQVYVDVDATGTADGSSWANAYPSLNDALVASDAGSSLWVADGTYTTPDSVSFFINKELSLYGGFNGTETTVDAADPAANVTIFSGDVNGDDVVGTYDSLANEDNNRVFVIVDTSSTGSKFVVTIDGVTIANGKVVENRPTVPNLVPVSGGGIQSFARLALNRIIFTENRADFGSVLALFNEAADDSVIDNITVKGNYSALFNQVFLSGVNNTTIRNSEFDGESTVQASGFIAASGILGLTVDNCTFSNLDVGTDVGAAMVVFDSDDISVSNSTFDGLDSRRGAGIYFQQAGNIVTDQDEDDFVMVNDTFRNCTITERGAAVVAFNSNLKIIGSVFEDNSAGDSGGAIYHISTDDRTFTEIITNTQFINQSAPNDGFGGAVLILGFGNDIIKATYDGCTFDGCTATDPAGSTGATIYANCFTPGDCDLTIKNTDVKNNVAGYGAMFLVNDVSIALSKVIFDNNGGTTPVTGGFQGGAVVAYMNDGSAGMTVDSCEFTNNSVTYSGSILSGGGAMYILGGPTQPVPVTITNSLFQSNATVDDSDGGAIYISRSVDLNVDNTDFISNTTSGQGGAMSLTSFIRAAQRDTVGDVITVTRQPFSSSISNSTFIDQNAGSQGGAIATSSIVSDLTNCVFINNTLGTDGASGGAVIFNGARPGIDTGNPTGFLPLGDLVLNATLAHNTFVDNLKGPSTTAVGDNLALYQPDESGLADELSMTITLLNNVFFSSTTDPSLEAEPDTGSETVPATGMPIGDLNIVSLGGNFFNGEIGTDFDGSLLATDIVNEMIEDPEVLFVDPFDNEDMGRNLSLVIGDMMGADNPLIDGGVANTLVPETDITGYPRGTTPDIGAYEADFNLTSVDQPIEDSGLQLEFFPNPTADVLNIRNTDATITSFQVLVSDMAGRILTGATFNGNVNSLDLTSMPSGIYNLQLIVNGSVYSKQVVKQ